MVRGKSWGALPANPPGWPGSGNSKTLCKEFSTQKLGKCIQFDYRIFFLMGWFNHQLADIDSDLFRIGFHPPQRSSGFSNKLLPVRRARGVKRIGSTFYYAVTCGSLALSAFWAMAIRAFLWKITPIVCKVLALRILTLLPVTVFWLKLRPPFGGLMREHRGQTSSIRISMYTYLYTHTYTHVYMYTYTRGLGNADPYTYKRVYI